MTVPTIADQETSVVAIKASTIYPVTASPIQDGIVLIRNGKIEAVGKDLKIPEGAEVIDATGKIVIPGLIDAFTTLAEKERDDEESVAPGIRAKDAFDFYGKYRRMLAGGVTTVYISPGQRRLISGLGAIAEILGIADRVGSIEKGKDADLVILTGEPFKIQSIVDKTLINGRIVYACPVAETKKKAVEESLIAIRARKIFTGSRGQINDGFILIRGSKIAYVGEPKAIPQEAIVIDASKSVVIPGMIDIHSHLGLHWESEPVRMNPSVPTSGPGSSKLRLVSIANAIAPNDKGFQEVLCSGVTSVLLAPETRGLVSGNAALIKLAGGSIQDMIVKEYAAIKFSMLGERARLAQIWEARDLLKKAKEYAEKWDEYERKLPEYKHRKATDKEGVVKEPDRPKRDANLELLRRLFKHEMPALVHANRADEISNALRVFRDEYNLDVIILGGDDSYRVIPELRKYNVGVAIGPNIIRYEKGKLVNNADLLTKNGLRVAFHTSATSGTQYLPMNAAYAVRYGMDEGKAFQAITSYPAELLHVNDRIGSIDVGKDADLVILSGEPFNFTSQVKKVFVNGRIVFERAE